MFQVKLETEFVVSAILMRSGLCYYTRSGKSTSLRSAPCPATPVRVNEEELDLVSLLTVIVKV